MYEIFSDHGTLDLKRSNHLSSTVTVKGGCILKSKSNNGLKKKALADLSNIVKQKNENCSLIKDDHQISILSTCDKKKNSAEMSNDTSRERHHRLLEKITDEKNVFPRASHEVCNYILDTPYLRSENISLDESSNSTFGENSSIEDDVFFGTYYSITEDERELISADSWDMDVPETIIEYCSEGGSCDESYGDRWLERPPWKTSEEFHQIVGVPETSKCATLTKLEDMEFTSLFSDTPSGVKGTLDVPDVLFASDYENNPPKFPVPDLEW